jgi:two-component system chemotaxis response regulator CheY
MKKLLIIDDDAVHRMVIARIAKKADLGVEFAGSVNVAVEHISGDKFCCVTLDLNLGENNGITLLSELAKQSYKPTVFVVSASEESQRQVVMDSANALELKMVDVPKPIDLKKLRELLEFQSATAAA